MEKASEDIEYFSLTSCLICPSPLCKCEYCNISLNECKLEDHYTICQNCINKTSGCTKIIPRNKLRNHLLRCPASIVVCQAQWNRQCLSCDAKKALKKYARYEKENKTKINLSKAIDIIAAQLDQQLIEEYFLVPRKDRVNCRDFFNPINPTLPLKLKIRDTFVDHKDKNSANKILIHDSSDEEKEEKLKAKSKKKTPYENCYLCKLDPTAQHLHVLGNQNTTNNNEEDNDNKRVNDVVNKMLEPFYEINHLYIDLLIKPYPALFIKGENLECIRKGLSLYPIRCGNVYHRLEHEDHCFYHNELQIPLMEGMIIKRCINYEKGCNFYVPIKYPNSGIFAFNDYLESFVCQPILNNDIINSSLYTEDCLEKKDLSDYLLDVIPLLTKYLDSADLNCLSATNRSLNYHLSSYFKNDKIVHIVDRKWIKNEEKKWEPGPFERKFSKVQKKFNFSSNPKVIGPLIDHSQKCPFNVPTNYDSQKVSTLLSKLQNNSNN